MLVGEPKIRVIGLDLMDTLLHDPYREAILAATGMELEAVREKQQRGVWPRFELAEIDEEEYAARFFPDGSPHRLDLRAMKEALHHGLRFLPGMRELLAELASRWPIAILSNYPPWYENLRRRFELDRFVSFHLPSYVLGARKPDAAFYDRALSWIGVDPGEMLFVDDREENVAAARERGIVAHRFTSAKALAFYCRGIRA